MAIVQDNLARKQIFIPAVKFDAAALRVAAYCRVSTDSNDQINSFAAQNNYYNKLISSNDSWELVDIYADAGITGTSAKKRKDFLRMLADCRRGKIDRILVKSISRFARNTAECLEVIRELKSLGISVYFEEHNIDTRMVTSEMLTAVLASCAQAESESISKNMRWSYQKRMLNGTYIPSSVPYGYRLIQKQIVVEPDEAAVVAQIFTMYLAGYSKLKIAEVLNRRNTLTRRGNPWDYCAIRYILRNERYLDFKAAVKTLQDHVENKIDLSERKTALQSCSIASDSQEFILSLYESILARCNWLLSYHDDTDTEIPYIQSRDEIIAAFSAMVEKLNSEIKVLQTVAESRDKLILRMQELVVIRWTHANLETKLRLILLKSVRTKCRTNTLTTLKKDLSKLLITDAYINRFQEEMNRLDTRRQIKVELVASAPRRGRSYHQVVLKDACAMGKHKNNEILSEGEFRVVSLAAFLSDLSSWNRNLPFIFDDPITSLDHLYENSAAKRLIELSMERQVIVFAHRLAFAQLIESAASEFNAASAMAGNPLRAQIKHIELRNSPLGHPSDPNYVGKMKLESAIKDLLNRDVPAIKKDLKDDRFSDADAKTLALCAEFRNMIEYGVEQNLLCGVVSRFSRNVSTMKLPCLYAITQEDISLFDSMMTKYSFYDHSQSIETPLPPPKIDDIEADLKRMADWAKSFAKRSDAEQKKAKGKA